MDLLKEFTGVLKAYGVVGAITFVGGVIILTQFSIEPNINKQIVLGVVGVMLMFLSILITYYRLKIQRDREGALISMVENTCNRLAEQIAKDLPSKQIDGIVQKIRQLQSNLIGAIIPNRITEEEYDDSSRRRQSSTEPTGSGVQFEK